MEGSPTHERPWVLFLDGVPACAGDLNGDRQVDLADFGCTPPATCPGDIDADGDTDLADLGILLSNFGEVCP